MPERTLATPDTESMDELRRDCRRIDSSWTVPRPAARPAPAGVAAVTVPAHGADLIAGMSEYGD